MRQPLAKPFPQNQKDQPRSQEIAQEVSDEDPNDYIPQLVHFQLPLGVEEWKHAVRGYLRRGETEESLCDFEIAQLSFRLWEGFQPRDTGSASYPAIP